MHLPTSIHTVASICEQRPSPIPDGPGVYAFWWVMDKATLLASNRTVILKGPNEVRVKVEYRDWWPAELTYPCLYVGKTTNLRKRFGRHIKSKSEGRLHAAHPEHHKAKPNTTSCQLRWGIEHIFPNELNPLNIISNSVGFSWRNNFADNDIAERFFTEDLLIGTWRPWFNIDSER
jgi:hypothetical protein